MPQAIEWSLATPKMSAFLPSSSPIRSLQRRRVGGRRAYHRADDHGDRPARRPLRRRPRPRARRRRRPRPRRRAGRRDRSRRSRRSGERGIPYRVVTNFSRLRRRRWRDWFAAGRARRSTAERIITGDLGVGRVHRGAPRRTGRSSSWPPRTTRRGVRRASSSCPARARPMALPTGGRAAVVIGDCRATTFVRNIDIAFRLIRGGADARRDAPQPVVADAEGLDARCRRATSPGSSSRPAGGRAILGKPSPAVFRQAVAGLARRPRRARASAVGLRDGRRRSAGRCRGGPARRAARGLRAVRQARPGRRRATAAASAAAGGPDAIAATLAEVVAALD